jgi:hypothetical protein
MTRLIRKHWPIIIVMGIYLVTMIVLVILSVNKNQGRLIYPVDDTYIHMAIAKNAVLYNVWGVTRYEFTSSTSSPLYTFLIAITYKVFGVNEYAPLLLNLLFGILTIIFSYYFLKKYITSQLRIFISLFITVFVMPLPSLTFLGMEHILQSLLSLCFIYVFIKTISKAEIRDRKQYLYLIILSPLVTTIRYEGIFLVFIVCILLLIQKRVFYAMAIGFTGLLPIVLYGFWSMAHGWYFFPNSVLLKGLLPKFSPGGLFDSAGGNSLKNIYESRIILLMVIASLFVLLLSNIRKEKLSEGIKYANLILIGIIFLHMQYALTGWFFRYEAYLLLIGFIVISISIDGLLPKNYLREIFQQKLPYYAALILTIIIFAYPYFNRGINSLWITPQATNNIYEQQYQMGTFLRDYYKGKTILVNDIGAVTYLADIRLIDLCGLGSMETAKLKRNNLFSMQQINNLSQNRDAATAIVYDAMLQTISGSPQQWKRMGQWEITNNVICASNKVSLYAISPISEEKLKQNLKQFAAKLPSDIKQSGDYTVKYN